MSFPADDPAARTDHAAEEPDAVLAASFSAGSDAAFAALYERYARPIHDFLRWTVRDAAAAEDLAQSTFLQALERRESLRDPAAFRGWLYRIAHNLAINHMTRTRAGEELDADAPYASDDPGPEQLAGAAEATELVWDAAASLEARQFAVLDLSVRKGLTSAEIAEVLEIDNAAASLAVHRAREALGNAVRFLLVARRRRHCERLAELVPEGVRRLTPEQRASVDRHMRRCPECQRTALLLTSAEQLFAATPLVSLPPILKRAPHIPKGKGRVARTGARRLLRSPWGLGAAAVVTAAAITTGALFVTHAGGTKPARRSSARSASTTAPGAPTAFASVAAAGFQPARTTNAPSTASFRAVACPSATHCFAVAENAGHALAASSSDSGATWKSAPVSDLSGLVAIACTSETACVAGGYAGNDQHAAVVRTSDAGSTWSPATVPAGVAIGSISCPDAKNCLAVGERQTPRTPYVVSSADGGATWEERAAPATGGYPGYLAAVQCIDAAHCWAVGGGIWFTDDLAGT